MKDHWEQAHRKRPWQNWVRSLGKMGYTPTHGDTERGLHPILSRQLKGMKNNVLGEKQQKPFQFVCTAKFMTSLLILLHPHKIL
jgi:hypothetical protein